RIIESPDNIGYWSAIKWVLDNAGQMTGRSYRYIYIIESDLCHTDLKPLGACERFLDNHPQTACVRTQEFSVRRRWRYDKEKTFLPFQKRRSLISLRNLVTG